MQMTHPATKPNGECDTPTCECHALASRTIADEGEPLEINPASLIAMLEQTAYAAGRSAERARVRAAIFDVLDAGDGSYTNHDGEKRPWGWLFQQTESDGETQRRMRFVDRVCERLEEL